MNAVVAVFMIVNIILLIVIIRIIIYLGDIINKVGDNVSNVNHDLFYVKTTIINNTSNYNESIKIIHSKLNTITTKILNVNNNTKDCLNKVSDIKDNLNEFRIKNEAKNSCTDSKMKSTSYKKSKFNTQAKNS